MSEWTEVPTCSVDRDSPRYTESPSHEWKITVDGDRVQDVVEASAAEGWVLKHTRDEEGKRVICGESVVKELVRGDVTIRYRKRE